MKGILQKSVFFILTFFVGWWGNTCWAVKIKNVALSAYITVDSQDHVLLTDDVSKATDFSINNAFEQTGKVVTLTLASDENKCLGWTLEGTVAIFLMSREPWLQLLIWRYDAQNKTLGWHWNENTAYLRAVGREDTPFSFTSRADNFARWILV